MIDQTRQSAADMGVALTAAEVVDRRELHTAFGQNRSDALRTVLPPAAC